MASSVQNVSYNDSDQSISLDTQSPTSQLTLSYSKYHSISSSDSDSASDITVTPSPSTPPPQTQLPSFDTPPLPSYSTLTPQTSPQTNPPSQPPSPDMVSDSPDDGISLFGSGNLVSHSSSTYTSQARAGTSSSRNRRVKATQKTQSCTPSQSQDPKCVKFILSGSANLHKSAHCASLMSKHICGQVSQFRLNDNGQIIKSKKVGKNKARSAKNLPETLTQWAQNKNLQAKAAPKAGAEQNSNRKRSESAEAEERREPDNSGSGANISGSAGSLPPLCLGSLAIQIWPLLTETRANKARLMNLHPPATPQWGMYMVFLSRLSFRIR